MTDASLPSPNERNLELRPRISYGRGSCHRDAALTSATSAIHAHFRPAAAPVVPCSSHIGMPSLGVTSRRGKCHEFQAGLGAGRVYPRPIRRRAGDELADHRTASSPKRTRTAQERASVCRSASGSRPRPFCDHPLHWRRRDAGLAVLRQHSKTYGRELIAAAGLAGADRAILVYAERQCFTRSACRPLAQSCRGAPGRGQTCSRHRQAAGDEAGCTDCQDFNGRGRGWHPGPKAGIDAGAFRPMTAAANHGIPKCHVPMRLI